MKHFKQDEKLDDNQKLQKNGEGMKLYGEDSFFGERGDFIPYSNSIINENDLIVTEKATRDTGEDNCCFSCGKSVGEKHDKDCQTIRKNIRININGYVDVSLPANINYQTTIAECETVVDNISACIDCHIEEVIGDILCNIKIYLATYDTKQLAVIEEDICLID